MAQTGESYAAARREVIREFRAAGSSGLAREPERFAISYDGMGPISTWTGTLFRRMRVSELIVSLVDPDGFVAALGG